MSAPELDSSSLSPRSMAICLEGYRRGMVSSRTVRPSSPTHSKARVIPSGGSGGSQAWRRSSSVPSLIRRVVTQTKNSAICRSPRSAGEGYYLKRETARLRAKRLAAARVCKRRPGCCYAGAGSANAACTSSAGIRAATPATAARSRRCCGNRRRDRAEICLRAGIPRGADQGNDLERRRQTGFCDQRIGVRSGAAEIR
jgi:hypothetical protein